MVAFKQKKIKKELRKTRDKQENKFIKKLKKKRKN